MAFSAAVGVITLPTFTATVLTLGCADGAVVPAAVLVPLAAFVAGAVVAGAVVAGA